jgi:hypothetical protein
MRVLLIQDETDIHLFHESSYFFDIGVRFVQEILVIIYLNSDLEIGRTWEKICRFFQPPNTEKAVTFKAGYESFLSHHSREPYVSNRMYNMRPMQRYEA